MGIKKPLVLTNGQIEELQSGDVIVDYTDYVRMPGYGIAVGTNDYTVSTSPALVSLVDGVSIYLAITNANTGASTLIWDGSIIKPIVDSHGVALVAGSIPANSIVGVRYNATNQNFQLLGEGGDSGSIDQGELILDGLVLRIDPDRDYYELDGDSNIIDYQITDFARKNGDFELSIGANIWEIDSVNYFPQNAKEVYYYPGATSSRGFRLSSSKYSAAFVDYVMSVQIKLTGTGSLFGAVVGNMAFVSTSDFSGYRFACFATSFRIDICNSGTIINLASKPHELIPDKWYNMKVYHIGSSIKMKMWPVDSIEPLLWDLETIDSTYSGGRIGVYASNSNVYAHFRDFYASILRGSWPIGTGTIISEDGVLKGKKRLKATTDFLMQYYPFGLADIPTRTVFMLYRYNSDSTRPNAPFFREYNSSLGFGVRGNSVSSNSPIIFKRPTSFTSVSSYLFVLNLTREDNLELVVASAESATSNLSCYLYGIPLKISTETSQWAITDYTELNVPAGLELIELLYYNRVLTQEEVDKIQKYIAFKYGSDLYMSSQVTSPLVAI